MRVMNWAAFEERFIVHRYSLSDLYLNEHVFHAS
jgi:hypothetical protein